MRQVESSAKSREEAIQLALNELGVEMYEVDNIEILDEGSRGIFGLGARPVKVRVRVDSLPDEPRPENRRESREDRPRKSGGGRDRGEKREGGGRDRGEKREGGGRERGEKREDRSGGRGGNGRGGRDRAENRGRESGTKEPRKADTRDNSSRNREDRKPKRQPVRGENQPAEAREQGTNDEDSIAVISDEQGHEAAAMLKEIIGHMGITATVEFMRSSDGNARLSVESEDSAILIGRKGRTLSAMQYLINRIVARNDTAENTERLVVDVAGYIDRRRESLQEMALNFAEKARSTGRNMRLKPLSPQERRIIHVTLQNESDIRTFSLGDSLYRSVIISPKDGRGDRSGRGGRGRGGRGGRGGRNRQGSPNRSRNNDDDFDAGQFGD